MNKNRGADLKKRALMKMEIDMIRRVEFMQLNLDRMKILFELYVKMRKSPAEEFVR